MPSSRKRRRKRARKSKSGQYDSLKRKIEQKPFGDVPEVTKINVTPKGEREMSEVLIEFVAPYRDFVETEEEYRRLLTLALVAWEASFFPAGEDREGYVDKLLESAKPTTNEVKEGLKTIVDGLIARKEAYFSEYTRRLVSFEVIDEGDEFRVLVVSLQPASQ